LLRAPFRAAQWLRLAAGAPLAIGGLGAAALLGPRRTLFLLLVPVYVLLVQAPMHFEPRFALPLYALCPAFEGTACALLLALAATAIRRRGPRAAGP
jgi:hypothetical protein